MCRVAQDEVLLSGDGTQLVADEIYRCKLL